MPFLPQSVGQAGERKILDVTPGKSQGITPLLTLPDFPCHDASVPNGTASQRRNGRT